MTNLEIIQQEIANLKTKLKVAKSELKMKNQKILRFKNKNGETIEGPGVLYYYVTDKFGKNHLKKASDCEEISQD